MTKKTLRLSVLSETTAKIDICEEYIECDYALEEAKGERDALASVIAALQFLDALGSAALGANSAHRLDQLRQQGVLLMEQAKTALSGPALDQVDSRYRQLLGALTKLGSEL